MRVFNYTLEGALSLGFFEAYRLFSIADEIKARELSHLSLIIAQPHLADQNKSQEITDWINGRQFRTRQTEQKIPQEVLDKFAEEFEAFNG